MENYDKVLKYTEASTQSAGTANEKYEAVLDSLDAKINTLTSTWDKMINNMNQSGTFGAVIDAGTSLLEILDMLINDWNILGNVVFPLGIIAGIKITRDNFSKLRQSVVDYKEELVNLKNLYSTVISDTSVKTSKTGKTKVDLNALSEINKIRKAIDELNSLKIDNFDEEFKKWADAVKPLSANVQALTLNTRGLNAEQIALVLATNNVSAADSAAALAKAGYNQKTIESALVTSNLATEENAASIASAGYTAATSAATASTTLFGKAISGLTAIWNASPLLVISVVVAALGGLAWVIDQCTTSVEKLAEAAESANQEFDSAKSELESLNSEIDNNRKKIAELLQLESPTYIQEEELEKLKQATIELNAQIQSKKTLAQMAGEEAIQTQGDLIKESYGDYSESRTNFQNSFDMGQPVLTMASNQDIMGKIALIDELSQKIEEETSFIDQKIREGLSTGSQEITEASNRMEVYLGVVEQLENELDNDPEGLGDALEDINTQLENYSDLADTGYDMSEMQDEWDELKQMRDRILGELDPEGLESLQWENILDTNGLKEGIDELEEQLKNGEIDSEEFKQKVSEAIKGVFDEINSNSEFKDYLIKNGVDPSVFNDLDSFKQKILEVSDVTSQLTDSQAWTIDTSNIKSEISSFATEAEQLSNTYSTLSDAQQELNENGYISASMFKELVDNNLLQYLQLTANGFKINTQALDDQSRASVQSAQFALKLAFAKDLEALATSGASDAEYYASETATSMGTNMSKAEIAARNMADGVMDATKALAAFSFVGSGVDISSFSGKQRQFNELINQYNQALSAINSVSSSFGAASNSISSGIGNVGDSAGSASNDVEDLTQKLQDLKQEMEDYRSDIEDLLETTMDMLKQKYQDQIDALDDQIEKIEDQIDLLEDQHDKQQEMYEDLNDKEDERYEQQKENLENLENEWEDYYDKQKEALEDELDDYQDKIDKEKELLELKEDEYQYEKDLSEHLDSVADIQDQLTALEYDNSIEGQKKKLELAEELAEQQSKLDEFQHDHGVDLAEDALDKEMERFEELQNQKIDALESENEKRKDNFEEEKDRQEQLHEEKLNQIQAQSDAETARYEQEKKNLESQKEALALQQEQIQEYISEEYNLRLEAIELIEGRTDEFYQDLIEWNRKYGTGVDQDIINKWNLAYAALDKFAGPDGLIKVQDTLEYLAKQANDFADQIEKANEKAKNLSSSLGGASGSMGDLVNQTNKLADALKEVNYQNEIIPEHVKYNTEHKLGVVVPEISKYHEGTKFVKKKKTPYDEALGVKDNETLAILKVGEAVIPSNQNSFSGKAAQEKYLDENVHDNLSKLKSSATRDISSYSSDMSISIGDIIINGNADQNTISALKKERENIVQSVFSRIQSHNQRSGFRNMKLYSI